jgi:ubiquinone/menaquinone biosynthesis C-methylase UbiE
VFARAFTWLVQRESREQRAHRRELVAGLAGRVLELGAGSGRNFAHYGPAVTEVVAVEPEPYMRARAAEAAAGASVPVRVVDGVADALPAADGSCDAAVVSLVLCSVPDQPGALAELRRVLRPGGELRFYEHVVARDARLRRRQELLDATVWPRLGGGCHITRDTGAAIEAAGFTIERCRRLSVMPLRILAPVAPHLLGVARRG